jgi:hypothetical protein
MREMKQRYVRYIVTDAELMLAVDGEAAANNNTR